MTGGELSEEEGPCPDTAATAPTSTVGSLPSTTPGEALHALGRRHDLSRSLIRIWVEKAVAGSLDQDMASAELLSEYEARIAALERLVGRQALEIELSRKGAQRNARPPRSGPTSDANGPADSPSNGAAR